MRTLKSGYQITNESDGIARGTVELIVDFLSSRPLTVLRQCDLWKLIKDKYPNEHQVSYWRGMKKEKHGIPPEVSMLIANDRRFKRVSIGKREVYLGLA